MIRAVRPVVGGRDTHWCWYAGGVLGDQGVAWVVIHRIVHHAKVITTKGSGSSTASKAVQVDPLPSPPTRPDMNNQRQVAQFLGRETTQQFKESGAAISPVGRMGKPDQARQQLRRKGFELGVESARVRQRAAAAGAAEVAPRAQGNGPGRRRTPGPVTCSPGGVLRICLGGELLAVTQPLTGQERAPARMTGGPLQGRCR